MGCGPSANSGAVTNPRMLEIGEGMKLQLDLWGAREIDRATKKFRLGLPDSKASTMDLHGIDKVFPALACFPLVVYCFKMIRN